MAYFWQNRHRCGYHCRHCAVDREMLTYRKRGELRVTNLSERTVEMKDDLAAALMDLPPGKTVA